MIDLNTSLLRETQSRSRAAHLVNNVLALKEDITKDAEANTVISLNTMYYYDSNKGGYSRRGWSSYMPEPSP